MTNTEKGHLVNQINTCLQHIENLTNIVRRTNQKCEEHKNNLKKAQEWAKKQ